MSKDNDTRRRVAARSGDTHVIGKAGDAVNIDAEARDKAASAPAKPANAKSKSKPAPTKGD